MNERMLELAEQARSYVADAIELGFPRDQVDDIRDEKFAELIVRECAGVCHTYGWGMLEHGRPGNSIADDCGVLIKEHFGVEE